MGSRRIRIWIKRSIDFSATWPRLPSLQQDTSKWHQKIKIIRNFSIDLLSCSSQCVFISVNYIFEIYDGIQIWLILTVFTNPKTKDWRKLRRADKSWNHDYDDKMMATKMTTAEAGTNHAMPNNIAINSMWRIFCPMELTSQWSWHVSPLIHRNKTEPFFFTYKK